MFSETEDPFGIRRGDFCRFSQAPATQPGDFPGDQRQKRRPVCFASERVRRHVRGVALKDQPLCGHLPDRFRQASGAGVSDNSADAERKTKLICLAGNFQAG